MNNGDQPAYPLDPGKQPGLNAGLTKRELIAAMIAQGMLSNSFWAEQYAQYERAGLAGNKTSKEQDVAEQAIKYADELLKQLETK